MMTNTNPSTEKPTLQSVNLVLTKAENLLECVLNGYTVEQDGASLSTNEILEITYDYLLDCQLQIEEIQQKITALYGKNSTNFAQKGA